MSKTANLVGVGLAGIGLAHFVIPGAFETLTAAAFPNDVREHLYIDGALETAIGFGLLVPQTRKLAWAGFVGYLGYLGANVVKNQTS